MASAEVDLSRARSTSASISSDNEPSTPTAPVVMESKVSEQIDRPQRTPSADPDRIKCAICLGDLVNKSYSNSCCHQFCFGCLVEWSKVKPECPLCKSTFRSIYHNIRTNDDYDEYHVPTPIPHLSFRITTDRYSPPEVMITRNNLGNHDYSIPHFRIGSSRTSHSLVRDPRFIRIVQFGFPGTSSQSRSEAIDVTLQGSAPAPHDNPFYSDTPEVFGSVLDLVNSTASSSNAQFSGYQMRRRRYDRNQWVRPFDSALQPGSVFFPSIEYFQRHSSAIRRISPWLHRELTVLLSLTRTRSQMAFVYDLVVSILPRYEIRSPEFRELLRTYFSTRTRHFQHEFYHFVLSGMRMEEYDRVAEYTTESSNLLGSSFVPSSLSGSHPPVVTIESDDEDMNNDNRNNDDVEIIISDDETSGQIPTTRLPSRRDDSISPALNDEEFRMLTDMLTTTTSRIARLASRAESNIRNPPPSSYDFLDSLDPFDLSDPPISRNDLLNFDPEMPVLEPQIDLNNLSVNRRTTPAVANFLTEPPLSSSSTPSSRHRASATIGLLNSLRTMISRGNSGTNNSENSESGHDPADGRRNPYPTHYTPSPTSSNLHRAPRSPSPYSRHNTQSRQRKESTTTTERPLFDPDPITNPNISSNNPATASCSYNSNMPISSIPRYPSSTDLTITGSVPGHQRSSCIYNNTTAAPENNSSSSVQIRIFPPVLDLSTRPCTSSSVIQSGPRSGNQETRVRSCSIDEGTVVVTTKKEEEEGECEYLGVHPVVKPPPLAVITLSSDDDDDEHRRYKNERIDQQPNDNIDRDLFMEFFRGSSNIETNHIQPRSSATTGNDLSSLPTENVVDRHLDAVATGFAYPMSMLPEYHNYSSYAYSPFPSVMAGGRTGDPSSSSVYQNPQAQPYNFSAPSPQTHLDYELYSLSVPPSTSPPIDIDYEESNTTKNSKSKSKSKLKKDSKPTKQESKSKTSKDKTQGEKRKRTTTPATATSSSTKAQKSKSESKEKSPSKRKKKDSKYKSRRLISTSSEDIVPECPSVFSPSSLSSDSEDDYESKQDAKKLAFKKNFPSCYKKNVSKKDKTSSKSKSKSSKKEKTDPSSRSKSLSVSTANAAASAIPSTSSGMSSSRNKKLKSVIIKVDKKKSKRKQFSIISDSSSSDEGDEELMKSKFKKLQSNVTQAVESTTSSSPSTSTSDGIKTAIFPAVTSELRCNSSTTNNSSPRLSTIISKTRLKLLRRWESEDENSQGAEQNENEDSETLLSIGCEDDSSSDEINNDDSDSDDKGNFGFKKTRLLGGRY